MRPFDLRMVRDIFRIFKQQRGRYFVESHLVKEQFGIGIIIGLHHINFLFYLLGNLLYLLFIAPYGDGVFMNIFDAGRRHVQALNVYLSTRKHCCYLI